MVVWHPRIAMLLFFNVVSLDLSERNTVCHDKITIELQLFVCANTFGGPVPKLGVSATMISHSSICLRISRNDRQVSAREWSMYAQ